MQRVPCRFFCMRCFFSTSSLHLCYMKKIKKTVNPFFSPKNDGSEDPVLHNPLALCVWTQLCQHNAAFEPGVREVLAPGAPSRLRLLCGSSQSDTVLACIRGPASGLSVHFSEEILSKGKG